MSLEQHTYIKPLLQIHVDKIMKYLKSLPDCFCFKKHGGIYGTAGIPDIIYCYQGKFITFDVKIEAGTLTQLQELTIERIRRAKGNSYKVTSKEEVKDILKQINAKKSE